METRDDTQRVTRMGLFQDLHPHALANLTDMEDFFVSGDGRMRFGDNNQPVPLTNGRFASAVPFNPMTSAHIDVIKTCTKAAKRSLSELQSIDFTVILSAATFALSWAFFPFWPLLAGSAFLLGRNLAIRDAAAQKQQLALKNLLCCWDWVMNRDPNTITRTDNTQHNLVQQMLEVLYPLVEPDLFLEITGDDIERDYKAEGDHVLANIKIGDRTLNADQVGALHKVYGYGQGGDWFSVIRSAVCHSFPGFISNLYNQASDLYEKYCTVPEEETGASHRA